MVWACVVVRVFIFLTIFDDISRGDEVFVRAWRFWAIVCGSTEVLYRGTFVRRILG